MDNLINEVKEEVLKEINNYKEQSPDHYDFWEEHIKYVYQEACNLAKKYNADNKIVSLGALLHDIALVKQVGDRKDHHINGKILSDKILDDYNCPKDIKEKVLGCVLNHRSAKNATNIEELCVCDADILAHFDNIPMLFNSALTRNGITLDKLDEWILNAFEHDYNDLSDRTREEFKDEYNTIKRIVLKK